MIDNIGKWFSDSYLNFPFDASHDGYKTDVLNGWVHILMLILFVCWGIFLIYVLIKFSSKNNPKAYYNGMKGKFSKYVEGGVIIFEVFLLFALAIPGFNDLKYNIPSDDEADLEIRVIAQQFQWNIHYPGEDGVFGTTYADSVNQDDQNFIGLSREGYGADDIVTMNKLHIPKDKLIKVKLSSMDVIHSFALPEMRVKQDAIPGMEVAIFFKAKTSTNEYLEYLENNNQLRYNSTLELNQETYDEFPEESKNLYRGYQISCNQLCGNSHYKMRGYMIVHEEDDFTDWLDSNKPEIEEDEEW